MNKQVNKFLEFNGKTLVFLAIDGQYWVALKPICEAIGVNWKRQHTNLLADPLFGQLSAEQEMVGADIKVRKMISLPEKWVLSQKAKAQLAIDEVMNSLAPDNILKIECSNKVINQINAKLRALDGVIIQEERNLFNN